MYFGNGVVAARRFGCGCVGTQVLRGVYGLGFGGIAGDLGLLGW